MTKVLWFSRHTMTPEQKGALEKKLGEIVITQVDKTIQSAFELKEDVEASDVICIVAPINIQSQFLKLAGNKPVLTAISNRRVIEDPQGGDSSVVFEFVRWDRIKKIEVVTETFAE